MCISRSASTLQLFHGRGMQNSLGRARTIGEKGVWGGGRGGVYLIAHLDVLTLLTNVHLSGAPAEFLCLCYVCPTPPHPSLVFSLGDSLAPKRAVPRLEEERAWLPLPHTPISASLWRLARSGGPVVPGQHLQRAPPGWLRGGPQSVWRLRTLRGGVHLVGVGWAGSLG